MTSVDARELGCWSFYRVARRGAGWAAGHAVASAAATIALQVINAYLACQGK